MPEQTATEIMLARLKIDLGIEHSTKYDTRLTSLLNTAKKEIEKEGATIDENETEDAELIIDYARYLWQSRRGDNNPESGIPRNLRWRINNRLFGRDRVRASGGDAE